MKERPGEVRRMRRLNRTLATLASPIAIAALAVGFGDENDNRSEGGITWTPCLPTISTHPPTTTTTATLARGRSQDNYAARNYPVAGLLLCLVLVWVLDIDFLPVLLLVGVLSTMWLASWLDAGIQVRNEGQVEDKVGDPT